MIDKIYSPKPPLTQAAVTIDPTHLTFDASLPKETYSLFVRENVGMEAYSVQVKMTFSQTSSSDFAFDTPSPKPIMEGSPLTDIQGMRCTDANHRPVVMFWIYRIEPHSTREITVTHKSDSAATIDSKITYFTTKPAPRTGDRIHATGTFHFDEPLNCNGDITFQLASVAPPVSTPQPAPVVKKPKPTLPITPLELTFTNVRSVEWRIANRSNHVVENATYYFGLFNLDRPELNRRVLPSGEVGMEPFRIPVAKADFINPDQPIGGQLLPIGMESMIRTGERVFGFAFTNCPGCKDIWYWVYFKQGESGWFSETTKANVGLPSGIYQDADKVLNDLVPLERRRMIK